MSNQIVWHYTTGEKFQQIVNDGYLDPKATLAPASERPMTWFSSNQQYEHTAVKLVVTGDGRARRLSTQETHDLGGGLIRFGVPRNRLIPWPKVGRKAGMEPRDIASLEKVGLNEGADPRQWLGTFKRIRVSDCIVEAYENGEWISVGW